jgi:hypothetical protein
MAELDEKLAKTLAAKTKLEAELIKMREEIDNVLIVIRAIGIETLHLETELHYQLKQM